MNKAQRNEGNAEKFEGSCYYIECDPRDGAESGLIVKHIRERAAQDLEGFFITVNGKSSSLVDVEGANIVEPEDVVGMSMGQQNGMEGIDSLAQGLLAKIGRGVDNHVVSVSREEQGRARAVVVGIL